MSTGRRRVVFTIEAIGTVAADAPESELEALEQELSDAVTLALIGNVAGPSVNLLRELSDV